MAPNITVPMNFGKHLLDSPTHSTLELKAKNGATVRASSVILSFNSPVIDHMTTTLHLTSVDMEEFSEKAVRYFVDAAYSGETPLISRDMFRDINKMSHVFKVTWLVTRCSELFTGIAKAIGEPTYQDFVFLFDEAYFSFAKLKSREIVKIAFNEIRSANGEEEFIPRYIKENLHTLSHQQMDLILELTGATNVQYVVKPLTQYLGDCLSKEDRDVSDNYKYLLDESDLYLCQQNTPIIAEKLFDVLEQVCLSPESLKWVFQLHRKVVKKPMQKTSAKASTKPTAKIDVETSAKTSAKNDAKANAKSTAKIDAGTSSKTNARNDTKASVKTSAKTSVKTVTASCSKTITKTASCSNNTGHAKEKPISGDGSEYVLKKIIPYGSKREIANKIEEIEQETNTVVRLNDDDLVTISGNFWNCKVAESIVDKIVINLQAGSMDIWVLTAALGRCIDKGSFILSKIEEAFGVKVDITNICVMCESKVILTGIKENVLSARDHINNIVDDEEIEMQLDWTN